MAFDRNKWKGASLSANKEESKKTEEQMKIPGSSDERPGFHQIKEGTNVFRICPPHNPNEPSFQPKVTVWLPQEVDEYKDDKKTGKKIVKDRPVFNSRVHGGTEDDVIEEYCNFVYKQVKDGCQDKDEIAKQLAPINGWRDKNLKWNPGIRFSTSYVFYAFQGSSLARLELWKADKDRMEELNINEDSDEPIVTDCFSDPNEGVSLIIVREKNEKGKYENILKKREFNPKKHKTWDEFISSEALTDAQLIELDKAPSLASLYKKSYKRSDFEKAVEGLRIFDEKHGFNIFENDEFLEICEKLDKYYPEEGEETEEDDEVSSSKVKGGDKFTSMGRSELKVFIRENALPITVTTKKTDDDLRELIREEMNNKVEETEEVEEDEIEEKEDDVLEEEKVMEKSNKTPKKEDEKKEPKDLPWDKEKDAGKAQSAAEKLAEMKAKFAKKK